MPAALHSFLPCSRSIGSVNALRFALSHPLVEADEGMRAPLHYLALTATAKMKRRERKLAPLTVGGATALTAPPTAKAVNIQTMEGMLKVRTPRLVFCARPWLGFVSPSVRGSGLYAHG